MNYQLKIEALCSAVQDSSVLVQRSMLDFLLVAFPLHNRQLTHADMARVVLATITVLLRRDMSLNRYMEAASYLDDVCKTEMACLYYKNHFACETI